MAKILKNFYINKDGKEYKVKGFTVDDPNNPGHTVEWKSEVTVSCTSSGDFTVTGLGTYEADTQITVVFTANTGYYFTAYPASDSSFTLTPSGSVTVQGNTYYTILTYVGTPQQDYIFSGVSTSTRTLDFDFYLNEGITNIYYKINGASSYTSINTDTTVYPNYGTNVIWYATASIEYDLDDTPDSLHPQTISNITSNDYVDAYAARKKFYVHTDHNVTTNPSGSHYGINIDGIWDSDTLYNKAWYGDTLSYNSTTHKLQCNAYSGGVRWEKGVWFEYKEWGPNQLQFTVTSIDCPVGTITSDVNVTANCLITWVPFSLTHFTGSSTDVRVIWSNANNEGDYGTTSPTTVYAGDKVRFWMDKNAIQSYGSWSSDGPISSGSEISMNTSGWSSTYNSITVKNNNNFTIDKIKFNGATSYPLYNVAPQQSVTAYGREYNRSYTIVFENEVPFVRPGYVYHPRNITNLDFTESYGSCEKYIVNGNGNPSYDHYLTPRYFGPSEDRGTLEYRWLENSTYYSTKDLGQLTISQGSDLQEAGNPGARQAYIRNRNNVAVTAVLYCYYQNVIPGSTNIGGGKYGKNINLAAYGASGYYTYISLNQRPNYATDIYVYFKAEGYYDTGDITCQIHKATS